MGVQRVVNLPSSEPTFAAVVAKWAESGEPAVVRMIDGLPAFPDEVPADDWHEIRVSVPSGMITIRRQPGGWACVVWGAADSSLLAARDRLCEAIATVSGGSTSDG